MKLCTLAVVLFVLIASWTLTSNAKSVSSYSASPKLITDTLAAKSDSTLLAESKLKKYIGKQPIGSNSSFWKTSLVKMELKRILGNDYEDYIKYLGEANQYFIEYKDGLLSGEVWIPHNATDNSIYIVDIRYKKMYVFKQDDFNGFKIPTKVYGDKPIPSYILHLIAQKINDNVYTVRIIGDSIDVKSKD